MSLTGRGRHRLRYPDPEPHLTTLEHVHVAAQHHFGLSEGPVERICACGFVWRDPGSGEPGG